MEGYGTYDTYYDFSLYKLNYKITNAENIINLHNN